MFIKSESVTYRQLNHLDHSCIFYIVAPHLKQLSDRALSSFFNLRFLYVPQLKEIEQDSLSMNHSLFKIVGGNIEKIGARGLMSCFSLS